MKSRQQIFWKIKLRHQILLGYATAIGVVIGISFFTYVNTIAVSKSVRKNDISQNFVLALDDASLGISQAEQAVRGYMLTQEESFVKNFQTGIDTYHASMKKMEAAAQTSQRRERVEKLRDLGEQFEKFDHQLIELVQSGKQVEAVKLFQTNHSQQLVRDFETLQNSLDLEQDKELEETTLQVINLSNQQVFLSWSGTFVAILMCFGIAYLISSKISQIIEEIAAKVTNSSHEIGNTVNLQETIL